MKRISSRDNAAFKRLRQLAHSGRERRKQGRTLADGVHLVQTYLARVGSPELLVASEQGAAHPEIAALLAQHPAADALLLSDALFAEVSPVDSPSGLLALIAIPPEPGGSVRDSCVVLDAVQDAGNVGTLLRTAAAAGVREALLTEGCAQAWSPRVLRAAMGAHFGLRIREHADAARLLEAYPGRIVATAVRGACSLFEADLRGPVAWLFGNEGAGLGETLAALAHERLHIPMEAAAESLNVAAAAAVCLFEQRRQRLAQAREIDGEATIARK